VKTGDETYWVTITVTLTLTRSPILWRIPVPVARCWTSGVLREAHACTQVETICVYIRPRQQNRNIIYKLLLGFLQLSPDKDIQTIPHPPFPPLPSSFPTASNEACPILPINTTNHMRTTPTMTTPTKIWSWTCKSWTP
jgi:hypothetical protein